VQKRRIFLLVCACVAAVAALLAPSSAWARQAEGVGEPEHLEIPGQPDAFFYRARVRGAAPIIMFLHGRGGNPAEDCRKWARVATQFGWLVCPQGPEDRGGGSRAWNNNPAAGKAIIDAAADALRAKYKRRVRTRGNVLVGFSEGAFIAMQVGLHDARRWNRWLILAANDQYWWGDAPGLLDENRRRIRRVFLLTGENDEVASNTQRVAAILKDKKIPTRVRIQTGMGHEVPADRMITTYRRPLRWLIAAN